MIKTPTFLVFPTISCQKPNRPKNHQDQINPKTIKPRKNTRWIYHIFSLLVRKRNGVYRLQNTWVGVGSYFGASRQWGPKRRDWQWQSQGGESQSGWPKTHLSKSRPIPIEDSEEPRDSWPQICQKQPASSLSLIRVHREKKKRREENRVVLQLEERSEKTLWLSGYNMVFVFFWNETFWFPILPFADSYLYPRMILIPPTRRFHTDQHHFSITMVCKIYFYFWSRFVK